MTAVTALFIDSNIALYAVGGPHRHKAACRDILEAATAGTVTLHASVELIQEVLHHRLRIDDRETAVAAARWLTDLCTVHPFTEDVARQMLELVATMNIRGRDVESFVEELKGRIDAEVRMPAAYYYTFGGTFENLQAASKRLMVAVPIALALIFLLLFFTFNSVKRALLIYTAIPMSAIGGVLALMARDMPFSISAGVGFIALFGLSLIHI